mmetsp:Transcript_26564/g.50484  ORF Transcript_26564/g.50484 Transcript_26564/m.50484 type:complete len:282 (-) Transcript_26564:1525-2370(-)
MVTSKSTKIGRWSERYSGLSDCNAFLRLPTVPPPRAAQRSSPKAPSRVLWPPLRDSDRLSGPKVASHIPFSAAAPSALSRSLADVGAKRTRGGAPPTPCGPAGPDGGASRNITRSARFTGNHEAKVAARGPATECSAAHASWKQVRDAERKGRVWSPNKKRHMRFSRPEPLRLKSPIARTGPWEAAAKRSTSAANSTACRCTTCSSYEKCATKTPSLGGGEVLDQGGLGVPNNARTSNSAFNRTRWFRSLSPGCIDSKVAEQFSNGIVLTRATPSSWPTSL